MSTMNVVYVELGQECRKYFLG